MKCASPRRQSMCRSLVRNEPTISRARLWSQPRSRSWRMPASTTGKPVRPSHHASKRLVVVLPLERVHLAPVCVARVAGVGEQHVRVEVAPAQLAHELGRALAGAGVAGALLELARRDAPEVQVRRELRRAALEPVVQVRVVLDAVAQPRVHALAARGLARRERVGHVGGQADRVGRRDLAGAHARRQRQRARRPVDLAPVEPLPRARERREDRERPAVLRPRLVHVRDEQARMPHDLHARLVHRLADPPVARQREAGHVRGEAQPRRAGLLAPARPARVPGRPRARRGPPRARAAPPAARRRQPSRKRPRGPDSKRPCSRASSSTNTGTTCSAARAAAVSAGWSCTRRSRRNQTISVSAIGGDTAQPARRTIPSPCRSSGTSRSSRSGWWRFRAS